MTDMIYEKNRNKLMPEAEKYANEMTGLRPKTGANREQHIEWSDKWNRAYHRRMNELAREKGLLCKKGDE